MQGHFLDTGGELEYCDRDLFEQVYRRTLNVLRREVEPVAARRLPGVPP